MTFLTTVYPFQGDEDDEHTYVTDERTRWEFDSEDRLHIYVGGNWLPIATHMPGTFEAIACEENEDV